PLRIARGHRDLLGRCPLFPVAAGAVPQQRRRLPMIRVANLSYSVQGRRLLDGVGFDVPAGKIVALVGPNGAGKSTALKLVSGDLRPENGEISIHGRPLSGWTLRELATCRAVVTQDTHLSFPFTALEVVLMGRIPSVPRLQRN